MARVTGNIENEDQNYSRRGSAARPGQMPTVMPQQGGNRMQQLLQAVGLQGMFGGGGQGTVITGDFSPEDLQRTGITTDAGRGATGRANVTAGGQGRNANVRSVTQGRGGIQMIPPTGARNALFPRGSLLAGALAGIPTAIGEATEGRPVGALGAVGGSATGAMLGATAARFIPGPLGAVARFAAPVVGGLLGAQPGAQAAEYAKRKITKEPTSGKEGELSSQLAAAEQMGNLQTQLYGQTLNTNMAAQKDMLGYVMNTQYEQMQRMNPLIQKMKNADLVRQQAMVNTMGQNYAMLGTLATAGKLATGAQAEAGATLRTALTTNPYAQNVLQAPSISFG